MTTRRSAYPLAALEALRRRRLDSARGELAAAIAAAQRARARVGAAAGMLREASRVSREAEGQAVGTSALGLDVRARWLSRLRSGERLLRDEVERCEEVAARAGAAEERCRERILEEERQVRAVERHRGLWERARRRAAQAAEEAELEGRPQRPT